MDVKKNRLAQDIDIDNNPVNKDIIPEDKDIKKETPTTPTPVITDKDNKIEEIPQPTPEPPRPAVKNNVRYIDGGFTF
jgi:hypothetical protein